MPKAQPKHLDKHELIGPKLVIKYHHDRPPNDATKRWLRRSASIACTAMRKTVWEIDKVALFRRDEPDWMTATLDKHFCLHRDSKLDSTPDGNKLANRRARRSFIHKVRKVMLSTSFHLNTGIYLLDVDAGNRATVGDFHLDQMDAGWKENAAAPNPVVSRNIEGYVQQRGGVFAGTGGSSSGPIHIAFSLSGTYTAERMARIIIHEATHTYCKTADVDYAHAANYDVHTPEDMLTNADSHAYAAMSIAAKQMLDYNGLKRYSFS